MSPGYDPPADPQLPFGSSTWLVARNKPGRAGKFAVMTQERGRIVMLQPKTGLRQGQRIDANEHAGDARAFLRMPAGSLPELAIARVETAGEVGAVLGGRKALNRVGRHSAVLNGRAVRTSALR